MADDSMSDEELLEKLKGAIGSGISSEDKISIHTFLHNVAISDDTIKTGYLIANDKLNELGVPKLPVRTLKELELYCSDIANMMPYSEYFKKRAEIVTATSLSRDAKLLTLAVLQKREIADVTKLRKQNKGWFKSKDKNEGEQA